MSKLKLFGFGLGSLILTTPLLAQRLTLDPRTPQDSRTNPPVLHFVPKADSFPLPGLQTKPDWALRSLGTTFTPADPQLGDIQVMQALVIPKNRIELAANNRPCFAIRGYQFSEQAGHSGVMKSNGMTTCQPANAVHAKTIEGTR